MSCRQPHDVPSDVAAEGGEVIVDGPDGLAISLTPEAALKTSARLRRAGRAAEAQQAEVHRPDDDG